MNWLFSVKQFEGICFSTSAVRLSKEGWRDITANAALFSELCWHDAGLGFHSEVLHLRALQWCIPSSRSGCREQGQQWTASSQLQQCLGLLLGQACRGRSHISVSFCSWELFRSFRDLGSRSVFLFPCLWERNGKWWSQIMCRDLSKITYREQGLCWHLPWPDDSSSPVKHPPDSKPDQSPPGEMSGLLVVCYRDFDIPSVTDLFLAIFCPGSVPQTESLQTSGVIFNKCVK